MAEERVVCRTPTHNKKPTRIVRWKYETVRRAILKAIPKGPEGLTFKDLPRRVASLLSKVEKEDLGSINWYTTTVKLDLEVKGEIRRVPGSTPQRLIRL